MNKIEINVPEGFEIDVKKSDLSKGLIEFKPVEKKLTYNDVAKDLFYHKSTYCFDCSNTNILNFKCSATSHYSLNSTSKEQLECLMAYNKLRNVAEYLNKQKVNIDGKNRYYHFLFNVEKKSVEIIDRKFYQASDAYFTSKELAKTAIEILGEEEIKKALFIY